jgi:hypothetical protein
MFDIININYSELLKSENKSNEFLNMLDYKVLKNVVINNINKDESILSKITNKDWKEDIENYINNNELLSKKEINEFIFD